MRVVAAEGTGQVFDLQGVEDAGVRESHHPVALEVQIRGDANADVRALLRDGVMRTADSGRGQASFEGGLQQRTGR